MVHEFKTQLIIEARLLHERDIPLPTDLHATMLEHGIDVEALLKDFDKKKRETR